MLYRIFSNIFSVHYFTIISLIFLCKTANAWTSEDLELFDLVEEINQNFYDLLGLDQTATSSDVRKAYRRLSLLFHPDKNKEEGAEAKFRNIISVSEVLKDENRRKQYDEILENGLPDWKMPIYYYRRARKMGLWELFLFLLLLLSGGQYIIAWSMYWEKKYEIEEVLTSRFKPKKKKKGKVQEDNSQDIIEDTVNQIPKPSALDLFPIKLTKLTITGLIYVSQNWREMLKKKEEIIEESSEEELVEDRVRKPRKRVKQELPEFSDLPASNNVSHSQDNNQHSEEEKVEYLKGEWTEHDTLALVKAMNKFQGGTINRWEKISSMIRRPVSEVTARAKSLKSSSLVANVPTALQGVTGNDNFEFSNTNNDGKNVKVKKLGGERMPTLSEPPLIAAKEPSKPETEVIWSQTQQRALENSLVKFPKGTDQRWEKIAEEIPGKTKEECIVRYKMLVEVIKKKKMGLS